MRPSGSVKNVALLCSGRKGPGGSGLGASGTLSPSSQPCGNGGSLTCAESLLRFCPTALLLCLYPLPVNRDPPPHQGTRKEVRMEVCVVRSPSVMGFFSIFQHLLSHGMR